MTQTIRDVFDLPRPEDIRAMGFVIRLREADAASAEVQDLVRDYVITPAVEKALPKILDDMDQVFKRGEEYGRFVHGSFGSGKSHFMTLLALLIEGAPAAWQKFGPLLAQHRAKQQAAGREAPDHQQWLADAGLLAVRIHMLSIRGRTTGLDRAVYDGFNAALQRRGKAPFEFFNVDAVFEEVRREAAAYGDVVWKHLEQANVVGGREAFEALASGSSQARERFARAWLAHKGRDPSSAGLDPRFSDGLHRLAEHAKAQGFGGVVFFIDEYLLWLGEKQGHEFTAEINNLNVMVDHNTGSRQAPVFVFVARQRNLQEFFPDLVDETKLHETLDHHLKRFEVTSLQDVELRHIVHGRVLRPREPAAIDAAVASLGERHEKILPALLAGADLAYLRDVYPFHPALIEMLVDVTSLMQRERSALRLLYELLVLHYPDLPLGEFLPVGAAFEAIFPEAGPEASKKVELMQDIHHQYYNRLRPAMKRMTDANPGEFTPDRYKALDQLVKTVLLAEVSPRLKGGGLTIERLVQLNSVDVEGETFRGMVNVALTDLQTLSSSRDGVSDLQVAGQGKTALVRYVLGRVSLGEFLSRARSKVDNVRTRFEVFYGALRKALALPNDAEFDHADREARFDVTWRRTKREGQVRLGNVREMVQEAFVPDGTYKVLIDYPWDEPGHTVDEDRMKAANVRKNKGAMYTACWLPRHFTPQELGVLTELAAVRFLLSAPGQEELLATENPQDRAKLVEQADLRRGNLEAQLADILREVYIRHGEVVALVSDVDGARPRETLRENLEHIASVLLDRRWPQHPQFLAEPKRSDLEVLVGWMVQASESTVSVAYDEEQGRVLRNFGNPLELVTLGQTKGTLRLDSRYLKEVLQQVDQDTVSWAPIAEQLREKYGFTDAVLNLFLCFVCQRDHRALDEINGARVEVRFDTPRSANLRLQRGTVVAPAEWHRLRDLGHTLFGVPKPPPHRSLQAQDLFAKALREHAAAKRKDIQDLHQKLVGLGVQSGARLSELSSLNARLAPLVEPGTDSHKALMGLLDHWPDDAADPLRALLPEIEVQDKALQKLDARAVTKLRRTTQHATLGVAVVAHLAKLDAMLAASQSDQRLTVDWVTQWDQVADGLVDDMVVAPPPPTRPRQEPKPVEPEPEAPEPAVSTPARHAVVVEQVLDPQDADAVSDLLAAVRSAVSARAGASVRVKLVIEGDDA